MATGDSRLSVTLLEETNPRVLAAFTRIEAMSDEEIRALAEGEPPIIVDAAERIIARRHGAE